MDTNAVSCGTDIPKFKGVVVGAVCGLCRLGIYLI